MEPDDGAMVAWAPPPVPQTAAVPRQQAGGTVQDGSRAPMVAGGAAGTFGLAALAGVAAGAGGGAVTGTLTIPLIGTVIGALLGGAVAAVPGLFVAGAAAVAAAGMLANPDGVRLLPRVLAGVGAAGASLIAIPVGLALLDPAGILVSVGVWSTVPFEAALLGWIGKVVVRRTHLADPPLAPSPAGHPPGGSWF